MPHRDPNQERNSDVLGINGTVDFRGSCLCSTTLKLRNQAMSKHVSKKKKTQKGVPNNAKQFGVSVELDRKECGTSRARTNQPETWSASPGTRHRRLKKLHAPVSVVPPFLNGDLKSKKGKETIHFQSTAETMTIIICTLVVWSGLIKTVFKKEALHRQYQNFLKPISRH